MVKRFTSLVSLIAVCSAAWADSPPNRETIQMVRCDQCDVASSEDIYLQKAIENAAIRRWIHDGESNGVLVVSNQKMSVTWYYLSDEGRLLQIGKLKDSYNDQSVVVTPFSPG